jgi:hypothetical protein
LGDELEQYLGKHVLVVYRELVRRPGWETVEEFGLFGRVFEIYTEPNQLGRMVAEQPDGDVFEFPLCELRPAELREYRLPDTGESVRPEFIGVIETVKTIPG